MSRMEKILPLATTLVIALCVVLTSSPGNGTVNTTAAQSSSSTVFANTTQTYSINEEYIQDSREKFDRMNRALLASRGDGSRLYDGRSAAIVATINDNNSNVRNYPDTEHDIITRLSKDDQVSVISRYNDWYKVQTSDNKTGWVNNKLIDFNNIGTYADVEALIAEIPAEKPAAVAPSAPKLSKGQQIVNYAKKYLGVKYVWGGTTPKGFDCSGLVKYVYGKFGVDLNRVASDQARQGKKVSRNNLKPGDLLFFDTNGGHNSINHVGIYVGSGRFIEASSASSHHKVIITDLDSGFYSSAFMTARRIFN